MPDNHRRFWGAVKGCRLAQRPFDSTGRVESSVAPLSEGSGERTLVKLLSLLVLPVMLLCCGGRSKDKLGPSSTQGDSVTISLSVWRERGAIGTDDFSRRTGIVVKVVPAAGDVSARLAQNLLWLNRHASTPDVYEADIIWPAILADHMTDLNPYLGGEVKRHLPAIVDNFRVDGRLIGMPFLTDVGSLFYRTDLLKKYGYSDPPQTWDELERMASRIQAGERAAGNGDFWGLAWNGAAGEELTRIALEWQVSYGGGQIIETDGTISVNNPKTVRALRMARGWVGTISPRNVTSYRHVDAFNLWRSGNAAFMRNWASAYRLSQEEDSAVRGKVGVTLLPSGGSGHVGLLGGWSLCVSKYSAHPVEAVELVRSLTSRSAQRERALSSFWLPTLSDLYDEPEVLRVNPYFAKLRNGVLQEAILRPSSITGKAYPDVSNAYSKAVHSVLTGEAPASGAMAELEKQLVNITRFKVAARKR